MVFLAYCIIFRRYFCYCGLSVYNTLLCSVRPPSQTFEDSLQVFNESCTAPVQCGCSAGLLPPLLFRAFLKITSGEGCIASRQGKQGSRGKLAACVFYQTIREC